MNKPVNYPSIEAGEVSEYKRSAATVSLDPESETLNMAYKPRFRRNKVYSLLVLLRPFTLLAPFIGVISGGILALAYYGQLSAPYIAAAPPFLRWDIPGTELFFSAVTFAGANAASNVINQVYDADIDRINKPYRPIPSNAITVNEAMTLGWLLYLVTLFRAGMFSRPMAHFLLIFMVITIIYSEPGNCLCPGPRAGPGRLVHVR
jgi:4-hydroxybenzoate polyprenyltransferase